MNEPPIAEKDVLTQGERRTYQSLLARGFSREDAMNAALDGVDIHDVRSVLPPAERSE